MSTLTVKDKEIINHIKPGISYLCYGTIQQIQYLMEKKMGYPIYPKVMYNPKTIDIIREAEYEALPWEAGSPRVIICVPDTMPDLTKKGSKSIYGLPADGYFTVAPLTYMFTVCLKKEERSKEWDKSIKALSNSKSYQVIDLSNLSYEEFNHSSLKDLRENYNWFPYTLREKVQQEELADDEFEANEEFVEVMRSLYTLSGVKRWGEFSSREIYKYFRVRMPDGSCLLMAKARAKDLNVFIEPFLDLIDNTEDHSLSQSLLHSFAYWVYCSSHYWTGLRREGLVERKYSQKKVTCFNFYASKRARIEWLKLLESHL